MKLQLVQPTLGKYRTNSRTGCYPPLGLVSIATHVKRECPSVEVEILDGEMMPHDEILARLDADIVGLNANTVTYPQALETAEAAKAAGAVVVLGGVYASAIPDRILARRSHLFDSVVVGYGEQAMVDIIRGRRDRRIEDQTAPFLRVPIPDRSFVEMEDYVETFRESHPTWDYRATNIFTSMGCLWRDKSGGCIFCSRAGKHTALKPPQLIWNEIRRLKDKYRIDYIVDFSDTLLQDVQWLEALVKAKPDGLDLHWHVFGRIDEVNPETISLLRKLPCKHMFVGIESGAPATFNATRKGGGSPEASLEMAKRLKQAGIGLTPSYVIGLPGETKTTLQQTYNHARRLKELTGFEEIFCCELIPFPGSPAFRALNARQPQKGDVFDMQNLKKNWSRQFCKVDWQSAEKCTSDILALGKYRITIKPENHRNLPAAHSPRATEAAVSA